MKPTPVLILAVLASARLHAAAETDPRSAIRQALESRFPETKVVDVRPSAMPGLYEVWSGDAMAYTDAKGDYLMLGQLMDTRTKRNLTAERMDELTSIDFATLPLEKAIKTVKGNGSRRLAVFSDPDCPYCQRLEKELASVTDVTIYTFLYPLADLHPEAPKKAQAIWCTKTKDRPQAWTQWMLEQKLPESAACDTGPLEENLKLGAALHVNSTPTLFAGSGRRVSGAIAAAQIESLLTTTQPALDRKPRS